MVAIKLRGVVTLGVISLVCLPLTAAILPEERADVLYHLYEGGGLRVGGPSIMVSKHLTQNASMSANYYVDSISSASIDVVTSASAYTEERTEKSVGLEILHDNVTMNLGYKVSNENDFDATTSSISITQSMLGDLTIVRLSYALGSDVVGRTMSAPGGGRMRDPDFAKDVARQSYGIGLSQIVTKKLLVDFVFDAITDEGYLNNPYRLVRYINPSDSTAYLYQGEEYPKTRTSRAAAVRFSYFLPYRAAINGEYRVYNDSWGIQASNFKLGYIQPYASSWLFEGRVRSYSQTGANFYSDLFSRASAQDYLARDKELSTFTTFTVGGTVSYRFKTPGWFIERGSLNFSYDRINIEYDDFRDLRVKDVPAGYEPRYTLDAQVYQLYLSAWY